MRFAAALTSSKSGILVIESRAPVGVASIHRTIARVSVHESIAAGCEPACHGCRHRQPDARGEPRAEAALSRACARAVARPTRAGALAPARRRATATATASRSTRAGTRASGWRFGLMRRDELIAIHDCPGAHAARQPPALPGCASAAARLRDFPLAYVHVAGAQATLIVKARAVDHGAARAACWTASPATGLDGAVAALSSVRRDASLFARSGWHRLWGRRGFGRRTAVSCTDRRRSSNCCPHCTPTSLKSAARHLAPRPGRCRAGPVLRHRRVAASAGPPPARTALGIELGGDAVECARRNAPRATVLRGTCVQRLPQVREWWRGAGGERARVRESAALGTRGGRWSRRSRTNCGPRGSPTCRAAPARSRATSPRSRRAATRSTRSSPFDFFPGHAPRRVPRAAASRGRLAAACVSSLR